MKKTTRIILCVYLAMLLYFVFRLPAPAYKIVIFSVGMIISYVLEWLSTVLVNRISKAASLMASPLAVVVLCLATGIIMDGTPANSTLPFIIILVAVIFDFVFPFFTEE